MKRTLFKKLRFNKINIENIEAKERRFNIYSYECEGLYIDVFTSRKTIYRVLYKLNYRNFHYAIGGVKKYESNNINTCLSRNFET